jgi:hypothetical protein
MSDMAQDVIKDAVSGFDEEIKISLAEDEFIAKDPQLFYMDDADDEEGIA